MRYKKTAEKMLHSYNSKVAWAGADSDEALVEVIDFVFPYRTDEEKANLFAMLKEHWSEYRAGIPRKLYVASVLGKWNHSIVRGSKKQETEDEDR